MKTTNLTFAEALAAMERGERVRRAKWSPGFAVVIDKTENAIRISESVYYRFRTQDFSATDWEIYKPIPALNPCGCGGEAKCISDEDQYRPYMVECSQCFNHTMRHYTREEAQRDWNRAHPVAKPDTKPKTNFEKFVTPEFIVSLFDCKDTIDIWRKCERLMGDRHKGGSWYDIFLEWANAPAEEETK